MSVDLVEGCRYLIRWIDDTEEIEVVYRCSRNGFLVFDTDNSILVCRLTSVILEKL
jgi:hypothetical protein